MSDKNRQAPDHQSDAARSTVDMATPSPSPGKSPIVEQLVGPSPVPSMIEAVRGITDHFQLTAPLIEGQVSGPPVDVELLESTYNRLRSAFGLSQEAADNPSTEATNENKNKTPRNASEREQQRRQEQAREPSEPTEKAAARAGASPFSMSQAPSVPGQEGLKRGGKMPLGLELPENLAELAGDMLPQGLELFEKLAKLGGDMVPHGLELPENLESLARGGGDEVPHGLELPETLARRGANRVPHGLELPENLAANQPRRADSTKGREAGVSRRARPTARDGSAADSQRQRGNGARPNTTDPVVRAAAPTTTEAVPSPNTTDPVVRSAPPYTTEAVPRPNTTDPVARQAPTSTEAVPYTTEAVPAPNTTEAVPAPNTTEAVPAPNTTEAVPAANTTEAVPAPTTPYTTEAVPAPTTPYTTEAVPAPSTPYTTEAVPARGDGGAPGLPFALEGLEPAMGAARAIAEPIATALGIPLDFIESAGDRFAGALSATPRDELSRRPAAAAETLTRSFERDALSPALGPSSSRADAATPAGAPLPRVAAAEVAPRGLAPELTTATSRSTNGEPLTLDGALDQAIAAGTAVGQRLSPHVEALGEKARALISGDAGGNETGDVITSALSLVDATVGEATAAIEGGEVETLVRGVAENTNQPTNEAGEAGEAGAAATGARGAAIGARRGAKGAVSRGVAGVAMRKRQARAAAGLANKLAGRGGKAGKRGDGAVPPPTGGIAEQLLGGLAQIAGQILPPGMTNIFESLGIPIEPGVAPGKEDDNPYDIDMSKMPPGLTPEQKKTWIAEEVAKKKAAAARGVSGKKGAAKAAGAGQATKLKQAGGKQAAQRKAKGGAAQKKAKAQGTAKKQKKAKNIGELKTRLKEKIEAEKKKLADSVKTDEAALKKKLAEQRKKAETDAKAAQKKVVDEIAKKEKAIDKEITDKIAEAHKEIDKELEEAKKKVEEQKEQITKKGDEEAKRIDTEAKKKAQDTITAGTKEASKTRQDGQTKAAAARKKGEAKAQQASSKAVADAKESKDDAAKKKAQQDGYAAATAARNAGNAEAQKIISDSLAKAKEIEAKAKKDAEQIKKNAVESVAEVKKTAAKNGGLLDLQLGMTVNTINMRKVTAEGKLKSEKTKKLADAKKKAKALTKQATEAADKAIIKINEQEKVSLKKLKAKNDSARKATLKKFDGQMAKLEKGTEADLEALEKETTTVCAQIDADVKGYVAAAKKETDYAVAKTNHDIKQEVAKIEKEGKTILKGVDRVAAEMSKKIDKEAAEAAKGSAKIAADNAKGRDKMAVALEKDVEKVANEKIDKLEQTEEEKQAERDEEARKKREAEEEKKRKEREAKEEEERKEREEKARKRRKKKRDERRAKKTAEAIADELDDTWTEDDAILDKLRGKSPEEIKLIKKAYKKKTGKNLEGVLKEGMGGSELKEAKALLNDDPVQKAVATIQNASEGWTSEADKQRIKDTLNDLPPDERKKVAAEYEKHTGERLNSMLDYELDDGDKEVFKVEEPEEKVYEGPDGEVDKKAVAAAEAEIRGAVNGWGTDEGKIFSALEGKTPGEIQAIKKLYNEKHAPETLDDRLEEELSSTDLKEAKALMSDDPVQKAVASLHNASDGVGTDPEKIHKTLEGITDPKLRAKVKEEYEKQTGEELGDMLEDELSGRDKDLAVALEEGDKAKAAAIKIEIATKSTVLGDVSDGIADTMGVDREAMRTVTTAAAVVAGGPLGPMIAMGTGADFGDDENAVYKALEGAETQEERDAIVAAYNERNKPATLDEDLKSQLTESEKDVADCLLVGDKTGAEAAKVKAAGDGLGTDEDAIFEAIEKCESKEERDALIARYNKEYGGKGGVDFDAMLEDELGDLDNTRAEQLVENGKMDDAFALHYAQHASDIAGFNIGGTDDKIIKDVLKGKSKEEIAKLKEDYKKIAGPDADLEDDLIGGGVFAETSGRTGKEIEIALRGKPETVEEALAWRQEMIDFERNDEGSVVGEVALFALTGPVGYGAMKLAGVDSGDISRGATDLWNPDASADLDASQARLQAAAADIEKNTKPNKDESPEDFEKRKLAMLNDEIDMESGYVENFQEAKDTTAEAAATGVGLVVTGAVTIATGGAAAPFIAALAGGLSGVATKAIISGGSYENEDIAKDLAEVAIEAVAAGLITPGIMGKAATGLKALGAADDIATTIMKEMLEEAIESGSSELLKQMLLNPDNWDTPEKFLKGVVGGTLQASATGAVAAGVTIGLHKVLPDADSALGKFLKEGLSEGIGGAAGQAVNPATWEGSGSAVVERFGKGFVENFLSAGMEGVGDAVGGRLKVGQNVIDTDTGEVFHDRTGEKIGKVVVDPNTGAVIDVSDPENPVGLGVNPNFKGREIGSSDTSTEHTPHSPDGVDTDTDTGTSTETEGTSTDTNIEVETNPNQTGKTLPGIGPAIDADVETEVESEIEARGREAEAEVNEIFSQPPPLQQQIDASTGVDRRADRDKTDSEIELDNFFEHQNRQGEAQVGQKISGRQVDGRDAGLGNYEWDFGGDVVEFDHGVVAVNYKVYLNPHADVGPADLAKVEAAVRQGVDQHYNNKHDITAPSGKPARLHVEIQFTNNPSDAHLVANIHPNDGNANLSNWFVDGHPTTHAHEIGHGIFGLFDEYIDSTVPNRRDSSQPGVKTDSSLMGDYWLRDEFGHPVLDALGNKMVDPDTGLKGRHIQQISDLMVALGLASANNNTDVDTGTDADTSTSEPGSVTPSIAVDQRVDHTDQTSEPAGPDAANAEDIAVAVKRRIADEGAGKFELQLTPSEVEIIVDVARGMGVDDQTIEHIIFVGSRDAKRKSAAEILQQIITFKTIVEPQGHPFLFDNKAEFDAFVSEANAIIKPSVPGGRIIVQGSSMRTPDARDLDLAVLVESGFDQLLVDSFSDKAKTTDRKPLDLTVETLQDLVADIAHDKAGPPPRKYNAFARTLMHAFNSRKIRYSDVPGLENVKDALEELQGIEIDISVVEGGTGFDLKPNFDITEGDGKDKNDDE